MNAVVGVGMMEETAMTADVEVTGEALRCGATIVFDQAQSRLHAITAVAVAPPGP
jgi:ornithine carbamoyltransferase